MSRLYIQNIIGGRLVSSDWSVPDFSYYTYYARTSSHIRLLCLIIVTSRVFCVQFLALSFLNINTNDIVPPQRPESVVL